MQGFFLAPILIFLAIPLVGVFIEVIQPGAKILSIKTSTDKAFVTETTLPKEESFLPVIKEQIKFKASSVFKK